MMLCFFAPVPVNESCDAENLITEALVILRRVAVGGEGDHVRVLQRALRDLGALADGDVHHGGTEAGAHQGFHLLGRVQPGLVLGEEDAVDLRRGRGLVAHLRHFGDGIDGLLVHVHGNEQLVTGRKGVDGEPAEGGRAVQEDDVVLVLDHGERPGEDQPVIRPVQDSLHRDEVGVGGDQVKVLPDMVDGDALLLEDSRDGVVRDVLEESSGEVSLGVQIHDEDPESPFDEVPGQRGYGSGLGDAAFAVPERDDDGLFHLMIV